MENDLSLPPNRPRPKGENFRKKAKGENRPKARATADAGVPTSVWLLALGIGVGFALLSTLDASGGSPDPTDTAPLPTPTGSNTTPTPEPVIQTGTATTTKPARRPLVIWQRPLVFVYVDSFGGEGIFDRLKTTPTLIDGHGLDRVTTLANGEFAGFYTGKFWSGITKSDGTTPVYLQLYIVIDQRGYNYWIDAAEVKQFHAPGATTYEGWKQGFPMTATTKQLITGWYAAHYV